MAEETPIKNNTTSSPPPSQSQPNVYLSGLPLSSLTGAVQDRTINLLNSGKAYGNHYFPPSKREEVQQQVTTFAQSRPKVAGFLLAHLLLSGTPLLVFAAFSTTVLVSSLLMGVVVGVLAALSVTGFAVGLALLILLPTLFVTIFAGIVLFVWGVIAWYVYAWFSGKESIGGRQSLVEASFLSNENDPVVKDGVRT